MYNLITRSLRLRDHIDDLAAAVERLVVDPVLSEVCASVDRRRYRTRRKRVDVRSNRWHSIWSRLISILRIVFDDRRRRLVSIGNRRADSQAAHCPQSGGAQYSTGVVTAAAAITVRTVVASAPASPVPICLPHVVVDSVHRGVMHRLFGFFLIFLQGICFVVPGLLVGHLIRVVRVVTLAVVLPGTAYSHYQRWWRSRLSQWCLDRFSE